MDSQDTGDFDSLVERVIVPALAPLEAERRRVVARFWRMVIGGAVTGVAVGAVFAIIGNNVDGEAVFWTAGMIAFAFAGFGFMPVAAFQKRSKARALGDLAAALGMTYTGDGFDPPALERMKTLRLIDSNYDQAEFEDRFAGERSGAAFELYEARMTRKSGKNRVTTFGGQILCIAFPKRFLGTTVVNRNSQRWFPPRGLQRVGLESSQFERIFEVFGDDQVEARYLVHPAFMERLMALESSVAGRNLRCAFDGGELLVAVEGGNLFEVVDVFKPLPDRDKTRKGVEELQAVLGLIDAILAPPPNVWADRAAHA
jgi:hypothetical protein